MKRRPSLSLTLGLMLAAAAAPVGAATLTYDFNNGLQGWTQIGSTVKAPWNSGGNAWGQTTAGSIYGYDGDDGADATYWVRSPAFQLDGSGPLTVRLWGGKANAACATNVSAVPANAISGAGFKGVALRDVATGNYVLSLYQTSDGANADYSLSVSDLAPYANNGKTYTLDFLDYDYGGWGWVGLDNVTIPGIPMVVTVTATTPSVFIGGNSTVVVTIPVNFNASAPVTVYLTNSRPSAITLNGSAATAVPVTFATGAPVSQSVAVVGTGLGVAKLTAGGAGLAGLGASVTVLPPSGLMGRWLVGTADLQDKSGYSPAGTHDGVLSGSVTPVWNSYDVPPGATGSALDLLSTAGQAVLITNTVVTDGNYQPTFDEGNAMQLSVVCWAKGYPGTWNPFVSKYGEGSTGWQVRRRGGDPIATFTVRSTAGEDDPYGGSTFIDDGAWHHFAATWDGVTGVRKLYVDGKLNFVVSHDTGPIGLANVNYLTLGGRSGAGSATPGNTFGGYLYDVQIYGTALSGSAVQNLFTMNTNAILAYADDTIINTGRTGQVSISIPAAANASTAVTVYVTNATPAIASLAGAVGNVVTLTFPAGGGTSQTVSLTGLAEGQAQLNCAAAALTSASATVQVYGGHLVGEWFTGTESYTNSSSFTAAGTHDGAEVGTVGNLTFVTDAPPSKPGKAANFGGGVSLQIANSSQLDYGYAPTFDTLLARQFSVSFWAKGLPGTWNPYVCKRGEDAIGWEVRRSSGLTEAFTIRGTASANSDGVGSVAINDGLWHHFAAVWDGYSGTRKCYVDGILDPSVNLTNDFGPMTLAANHHLVIGGRETAGVSTYPGLESTYTGTMYDVRVYNYPLSTTEVKNLAFIPSIKVVATQRSLQAPLTMPVQIILPDGANQSQQVVVTVTNTTPALVSLLGASNNIVTLTYPVGGSLTQAVTVAGIADGRATLAAAGGGFLPGSATFNIWADPGSRLIGHWLMGTPDLIETSGFRPPGTHDGVAVGANAAYVTFSSDVPPSAPTGAYSLDLTVGSAAVMITNSSATELTYVETFDNQMANKFSIAFWAKGPTPPAEDWNAWISKRGEDNLGYQVRRNGTSNPVQPTFTIRGTAGADDPASAGLDTSVWHHYTGTWDGTTGLRKIYVDGKQVLGLTGDYGPFALATADHFTLGALDTGGFRRFFPCLLYDVRVYSYALNSFEVGAIATPPTNFSLTISALTIPTNEVVQLVVTVPAGATATTPVTVQLTNNSPTVVTILGSSTITFPVGTLVQVVNLKTIGAGQINITAGAVGLGTAGLTTVNLVVRPQLIGHWLTGTPDLTDKSGFTLPGTHDGIAVGANATNLAYSADVPPGFTGSSLDLTANSNSAVNVGVIITNSAMSDGAYLPTFDDGIAATFSVALWTKGFPSTWNGFISKRGENGIGWQVRRHGGDNSETFTIRGAAAGNDDPAGSIAINDGKWHHFAAVWDGLAGTRKCYVDGVLDPSINLIGDFGPMSLAPNHHVGIGTRESGTPGAFESWFPGKIYDVRIYNYPISAAEVTSLAAVRPPLRIQSWTNNQVRISWPTLYSSFTLQQSASVSGGWTDWSSSIATEGSENAVYVSTATGPLFFRLKQ